MYNESGWFEKTFKHLGQKFKRKYLFKGCYSFFRCSVHRGMDTTEKGLDYLRSASQDEINQTFDWMIVSHEADFADEEPDSFARCQTIVSRYSLPKALFIGHPQPEYIPPDALLDEFDLIFKGEPFTDKVR